MSHMSSKLLHNLAEAHLKDFVKTVYNLVAIDKVNFDLVIGAGNSGLVMLKIAELIFEQCNWEFPSQLELPIQRYVSGSEGELYDNTSLMPCAEKQMRNISNLANVLFVDDELGRGTTAKASLALMLCAANSNLLTEKVHCHIVVELRDWPGCFDIPGVKPFIHHYPTMSTIHCWRVIMNYFRPPILDDIVNFLKSLNTEVVKFDDKCLNIALGVQSKVYNPSSNIPPEFTDDLNAKAKAEISGLDNAKSGFRKYLNEVITEAIHEASKSKDDIYSCNT